jgi:hypothetical protein
MSREADRIAGETFEHLALSCWVIRSQPPEVAARRSKITLSLVHCQMD